MADPVRNPKKLQAQLDEFQNVQRQLQMIAVQRQQVQLQIEELKMADEELKTAGGKIYKAVGNLLIETTKESAKKDLVEKIDTFGLRSATLSRQEEKMRARTEELRLTLEKLVGKPDDIGS